MNVRIATKDDAAAASAIAAKVFHMACPPDTPQPDLDSYVRASLSPAHLAAVAESSTQRCHVAEIDEGIAGFSVVNFAPEVIDIPKADGMPELTRCYVAENHQGKGVAQALLAHSLAGIDGPIRLMVNDQNARAIRFYCRNGFEEVGAVSFACGTDVHRDIVMVRF